MDLNELQQHYSQFFELFEKKYDQVYYMAIDAEWYEYADKNIVLSYQIATASSSLSNNIIKYMHQGQRLKLVEIIELGIASVTPEDENKPLQGSKTLVILISHSVTAEWSVLDDRKASYITKHLNLVRKSPITGLHPMKLDSSLYYTLHVKIFDTTLLAPASHKSLKKLSALLGGEDEEKETITQFYIERMNLYLRDHPDQFEKYALKDSEITLKLFFYCKSH